MLCEKAREGDGMRKSKRAEIWRRVREVIRAYPGMSAAADAGTLPPQRQREYEAVRDALRRAERLPDGQWRVRLVRQTLMTDGRTVAGAALDCHVSERTAQRWTSAFILSVARKLYWI